MTELEQALAFLPHGPEFRFIDRLVSLKPGKEGVGEYRVRGDEPFLAGHFPGQPLFPGVLLIEAAAQLSGVVGQSDPSIAPLAGLKLTAVRSAKIFGSVCPNETLQVQATLLARLGSLVQTRAIVSVENRVLLECELTLSGEPK
jgi:3-hydroxyacyl-[acyl-carrier-protein] dehydratase